MTSDRPITLAEIDSDLRQHEASNSGLRTAEFVVRYRRGDLAGVKDPDLWYSDWRAYILLAAEDDRDHPRDDAGSDSEYQEDEGPGGGLHYF